jgi:ABC-type sugar transport system ATPase subunit
MDRANVPHAFKATVRLVEPLGDCANVHLIASGESALVTRVAGAQAYGIGEEVAVAFEPSGVHLFSADEAGRRLHPS